MVFKKKKPAFERQPEAQMEEEEIVEEEFDEEELEVPEPQPTRRPVQVQPKKVIQPVQEEKPDWSVEEYPQVPTQAIIFNSKEKRAYSIQEALAELLNRTEVED